MSTNTFITSFLVGWPLAVGGALAGRTWLVDTHLALPEYGAWSFLTVAPIAACLIAARGQAPRAIAHGPYDVEQAGVERSVAVARV